MSNYSSLKATINANVKTNDNQEITGSIMNSVLNAMVNSLGAGYQFIGVATPTNPGTAQTQDYKCFYLATTPGTYTNLGGLVVADGEVALLKYDSSWTKEVTGIATADCVNRICQKIINYVAITGEGIETGNIPKCEIVNGRFYVADSPYMYHHLNYVQVSKGDIIFCKATGHNNQNRGVLLFSSVPADGGQYVALELKTEDINSYYIVPSDGYLGVYYTDKGEMAYPGNTNNIIGGLFDKIETKQYEGENRGSAWYFPDFPVVANTTYLIKLVSGFGNNVRLSVGNTQSEERLVLGEYVAVTPLASGTPYLYHGGAPGTQPIIEVASTDNMIVPLENRIANLEKGIVYHDINVSVDGISRSGRTIHFSGITAIADALNSITDASYYNRYRINIEGVFHFTSPSQLTMPDVDNEEYSVIYAKPYVDFVGLGEDRSVIFVDLPSDEFPSGKNYSHYQPIYVDCGGETNISNMTIIGKNCRYTIHFEFRGVGAKRSVKNCKVIHLGLEGISSLGFEKAFGTGMGGSHEWNIENCYIESPSREIAIHTMLADYYKQGCVNIKNCKLAKSGIAVQNYPNVSIMNVNIKDCSFGKDAMVIIDTNARGERELATTYMSGLVAMSGENAIITNNCKRGRVLRIDSVTRGQGVSFDISSSAFNLIVGDSSKDERIFTNEAIWSQYGYYFKSGCAYGSKDIDSHSLGAILGDCSTNNKTLKLSVNSVEYSIVFNEDLTDKDNAYVIGIINSVLDGVAVASVFNINQEYFPAIKGLDMLQNVDANEIIAGMGIVFANGGMRKAFNSDGYIDGVCLDTIQPGEKGRILTTGFLHTYNRQEDLRFTIMDVDNTSKVIGTEFGISASNPGYFDADASPKLLRITAADVVKINP